LALVARRPQGFPAHRHPEVSFGAHSSLRLDLSSTAPDSTHRSPPALTNQLRSDYHPEVFPLRHFQPREPVFFECAEPPRISTPPARFRPPRRLSAPPASPTFRSGAPLGFALQGIFLAGERPPRLRGDPPSCQLATAPELDAACATPSCFGTPTAGPVSHLRVRTSRANVLGTLGPAALLSFQLLQGSLSSRVARPIGPAPPRALSRKPPCGGPRLRLRGSTRCWIGLSSLDDRRPS